jgi:hypothetical protein
MAAVAVRIPKDRAAVVLLVLVLVEQSALFGPGILVHSHQLVQVTRNEPVY